MSSAGTVTIRRLPNERPATWLLETSLWFPRPRADVFHFFADADNLEAITPPLLHFRILTPRPIAMRRGTLLDYTLRLHGFPIRWRTEISGWEPPHAFRDRQLRGPYLLWEHEHTFEEVLEGTRMHDRVRFRPPFGELANLLLVRRDLTTIFEYRREHMVRLLG